MSERYNLYNLEAPFREYLFALNHKLISIKNYLSDFRHFAGWFVGNDPRVVPDDKGGHGDPPLQETITSKTISEYKSYLELNNIPHKTINRRLSTLRKFCSFCISQGWLKENPAKKVGNVRLDPHLPFDNTQDKHGDDILKIFHQNLLKENLDSQIINSYLDDIRDFLKV